MPDGHAALMQEVMARTEPLPPAPRNVRWLPEHEGWLWRLRQEMLPDIHPSMPRVIVRDLGTTPDRSNNQLAYTAPNDPHIYVNAFTDVYKKARQGDDEARKNLAALLAHEYAHIYQPDASEDVAYDAQIERLRRLGASDKAIRGVEQARDHTRAQQRK